jgi:hypothetical protein
MDNLVTLCLVGVFLIVGLMLLTRLMRGLGGNSYSQQGSNSPQYDDPNIESGGAFGAPAGDRERPRYDAPDIQSRGAFGRRGRIGRLTSGLSSAGRRSSGRVDSSKVKSRGGFGRSKD